VDAGKKRKKLSTKSASPSLSVRGRGKEKFKKAKQHSFLVPHISAPKEEKTSKGKEGELNSLTTSPSAMPRGRRVERASLPSPFSRGGRGTGESSPRLA